MLVGTKPLTEQQCWHHQRCSTHPRAFPQEVLMFLDHNITILILLQHLPGDNELMQHICCSNYPYNTAVTIRMVTCWLLMTPVGWWTCITRSLYINSSWPSDVIWHQLSWSPFVQILLVTCSVPSHHLSQHWLIVSWMLWNKLHEIWIKMQKCCFFFKKRFRKLWPFYSGLYVLTHWGQATHICVSKLTIIASDNGSAPGRRQAIIWNDAGILSIGHLETNFSEILMEILTFSFKKMHLKVSSAKWWPFRLCLNVLREHNPWSLSPQWQGTA